MSDQELLELLLSPRDQTRAFEFIYREFGPGIIRYLMKKGTSKEEAEDVLQESITAIYLMAKAGRLKVKVGVEQLLYGISKRVWIRKLDKRRNSQGRVREEVPDDITWSKILHEHDDTMRQHEEQRERKKEQKELLLRWLSQIGPKCQELVRMFYLEELQLDDIARILGRPKESIKVSKSRCIDQLKKIAGTQN